MITEYCSINNSLFYNNTGGITSLFGDININNSQFTNHSNFGISTAL
jgi:hypothetical protein